MRRTGVPALFCGLAVLALAVTAPAAGAAKPKPTKPGAPTGVTATAGVRRITVTFTKPSSNGGAKIDNYRATCTSSDGGKTRSHNGDKSPIKVDGLTSGKTYTCAVAAHNKVGFGDPGGPSNSVTLPTVPGKPSVTSVTPGKHRITVAFTAGSDGGSPITSYHAKCATTTGKPQGHAHDGKKSPIVVDGLQAGKSYTCTVAARNKVGRGPASDPSSPATPTK
jgi:hypothetical protein